MNLKFIKGVEKIERLFIVFILIFSLIIVEISVVNAANSQFGSSYGPSFGGSYTVIGSPSTNVQHYSPSFSGAGGYISPRVYWPDFDEEMCRERQDFIVQVAPGGCQPAVVRSDLLEEQNVPVFCKLMLIQTNPLVDVSRVKSIRFTGKYPEGVSGVSYFPSKYNLMQRRDLADPPIDDNMGYFVVNLKRQKSEDEMPDWVEGNLTAVIHYDLEDALGIGKTNFYVSELSNEEWLRDYKDYSFWNGQAYLKAESIEEERVTVSVYRDMDSKISSVTLKKGETSNPIYLPGFYCAAGLKVRVEDIQAPVESALLQIDDKQIWVAKGDKILDGKCSIRDVDVYSGGGKVSISCPVRDGKFDLRLDPNKVTLEINDKKADYNIGSKLDVEGISIYLGYIGEKGEKFIVLVNDSHSSNEAEFQDKDVYSVVNSIIESNRYESITEIDETIEKEVKSKIISQYKRKGRGGSLEESNIFILKEGETSGVLKINFLKATLSENQNWEGETNKTRLLAYDYYKEAIRNYKDLVDFYPQEKRIDEDYFEPYAAEGLYRAATLAGKFNMSEDRDEFLTRLRREYPDSAWARKAESEEGRLLKYDSSQARALVNLRDGSYFIDLLDFEEPKKEDLSVDLLIEGNYENLGLGEVLEVEKGGEKNGSIQVTEIDEDYVKLKYTLPGLERGSETATLDLDKNKQTVFEEISVKLVNINLNKQAKISLDSTVRGPRAQANFSFKVGIEKRGIKLSPEKTKEMMENMEESIEKWEDVNDKLGKVVKGLKGACFASSALLTVKNMFEGFGGKSMARNEVMTKAGGWNDYCEKIVSGGEVAMNGKTYSSIQKCLLDHNSDIEKDVGIIAKKLEAENKRLEDLRKEKGIEVKKGFLDFEGQVDRKQMDEAIKESLLGECGSWSFELPKKGDEPGEKFNSGDACKDATSRQLQDMKKNYELWKDTGLSKVGRDMYGNEVSRIGLNVQNYHDWNVARDAAEAEVKEKGLGVRPTLLGDDRITLANIKRLTSSDISATYKEFEGLENGNKIMRAFIPEKESFGKETFIATSAVAGKYAIIKLKEDPDARGTYALDKTYTIGGITNDNITKDVKDYLSLRRATRFRESDAKAYENRMLNPENLQVKYFDRAPYKGLPAEVPFDVENGWYVELEYVLSGFGKPYDESGRAANYYICNVGPNNRIEFKRSDDICRYYNGINDALGFPGMSAGESRQLIGRAQNALYEASKYSGKEYAYINGGKFKTGISFGGEAGRCSDFMSPQDCHWMFNLCDPVICPSSRCDLGGDFPVDNVIQTGIIGSIVLCLPNFQEGIAVPVCLSGVHAGIEGYVSILESTRDCLNESLETGKNIGICDEIKSIYLCEFFWRQMVPFFDVLIPKLVESFYKQGVRGGGEYLTVQSAWRNTESAIDYFKDDYAINSMNAFNLRSTEEAGGEICKSFVSTRYPTDFDLLTEPDSPVQYHAWFDENVLTTATPYPTSHYKVYYHIYAGNDQGAYYVIYLKDISEEFSSLYTYTPEHYVVDRGYIPKGSHVDEARDFTAPSGYKKLCVNINGQDECDFGKVSTSYAVNYLSDQYAEEQARQQITTSKECVAGKPSLWSLAQPNLQAGAEEFIEPELYNQGIVRVCSTYNPGKQVLPSGEYDITNSTFDRWKDVGECDDPSLRCWLDTESVKTVIENKELEEGVLREVDTSIIGEGYLSHGESREIANEIEKLLNNEKVEGKSLKSVTAEKNKAIIDANIKEFVDELAELASFGPSNSYRARGLLLLGRLYERIAKIILGVDDEDESGNTEDEEGVDAITPGKGKEEVVKTVGEDDEEEESEEEEREAEEITYEENQVFKYDKYYLQYRRKYLILSKEWMFTTVKNPFEDPKWYSVAGEDLRFLSGLDFEEGVEEILEEDGSPYF